MLITNKVKSRFEWDWPSFFLRLMNWFCCCFEEPLWREVLFCLLIILIILIFYLAKNVGLPNDRFFTWFVFLHSFLYSVWWLLWVKYDCVIIILFFILQYSSADLSPKTGPTQHPHHYQPILYYPSIPCPQPPLLAHLPFCFSHKRQCQHDVIMTLLQHFLSLKQGGTSIGCEESN